LSVAPTDVATCMSYSGIDPFTKEAVSIAKALRDRKLQRALLQYFKPENGFAVREALIEAGRHDRIGSGCDCLIPADPPREAIEARRRQANDQDHHHAVADPVQGVKPGGRGLANQGYLPGRKSARVRREKGDRQ
jgi:Domain of unknown function (DUF3362)